MNRYIFLDFDGVINTPRHRHTLTQKGLPTRDEYGPFFDPSAVAQLEKIVAATNAGIVITSSWKYKGIDKMRSLWALRGMPGTLLGITPTAIPNFMYARGREVNMWLSENAPDNPLELRYVIIDDDTDFLPEQQPHLIITDPIIGLTSKDAEKAKAILL